MHSYAKRHQATPNHALQRTGSAVTAPAADHRRLAAHRQVPRPLRLSLSLGSLGGVRTSHTITMQTQNQERFDRLRALAPVDAVRAWLDGDFGIGDEPAMIAAIRRDTRVSLSDDDITDAVCDAMDESLDAPACLERLAAQR